MSEQNLYLTLTDKELPDLAQWKAGKEYEVLARIKMVKMTKEMNEKGKELKADFSIVNIRDVEEADMKYRSKFQKVAKEAMKDSLVKNKPEEKNETYVTLRTEPYVS